MQLSSYQMPGVLEDARQDALHPTYGAILFLSRTEHRLTIFLIFFEFLRLLANVMDADSSP